jgi:hypothetical protein
VSETQRFPGMLLGAKLTCESFGKHRDYDVTAVSKMYRRSGASAAESPMGMPMMPRAWSK